MMISIQGGRNMQMNKCAVFHKLGVLLMCVMGLLLTSCASDKEPFTKYKNKSAAQIFTQAEKHLANKDYRSAVKGLEALDGLYPFGAYSQQGQSDAIYAYYKDGSPALALATAQRYIRLYPRASHVDYAYYMQGVINFNMGGGWLQNRLGLDRSSRDISNFDAAFSSFALLVERYPRSVYAYDAYQRMLFIRNIIANHEYEIAQFYWQRHAYVAAANRASFIVQHFQGAIDVVPAWGMLVRANRCLGLPVQATQNMRILAYNYSGSETYQRLRTARTTC